MSINFDHVRPTYNCVQLFNNTDDQDPNASPDLLLGWGQSIVFVCIVSMLYIPVMVLIWKERNKQAVYFKSPKMILIGGMALYSDSLINIIINSDALWTVRSEAIGVCVLSILTTLTFHYIGYFSVIFRAKRIFKVMHLTKKYLDRIEQLAQDGGNHSIYGAGTGSAVESKTSGAAERFNNETISDASARSPLMPDNRQFMTAS